MKLLFAYYHQRDCDGTAVQCGWHEKGTMNSSGGNIIENILFVDQEGDGSTLVLITCNDGLNWLSIVALILTRLKLYVCKDS